MKPHQRAARASFQWSQASRLALNGPALFATSESRGVEVFTSERPISWKYTGRASRHAQQIFAFYHHITEIDPNPAETTTCTFAQLDICFRRLRGRTGRARR